MTTPRNLHRATFTRQTRVLLSWLGVCGVLMALFFSPDARAYAPMCDETGASINAPLPAPPAYSGEISAIDCDLVFEDQSRLVPGLPGHPEGPAHTVVEFDAVLGLDLGGARWACQYRSLTRTVQTVRSSDHRRRVERPPCGG